MYGQGWSPHEHTELCVVVVVVVVVILVLRNIHGIMPGPSAVYAKPSVGKSGSAWIGGLGSALQNTPDQQSRKTSANTPPDSIRQEVDSRQRDDVPSLFQQVLREQRDTRERERVDEMFGGISKNWSPSWRKTGA